MKDQKGITLVALVITIIVMLILVGVSITIALNGGLFDITKKAAKDTKDAAEAETNFSSGQVNIENQGIVNIDEYTNINNPGTTGTPPENN